MVQVDSPWWLVAALLLAIWLAFGGRRGELAITVPSLRYWSTAPTTALSGLRRSLLPLAGFLTVAGLAGIAVQDPRPPPILLWVDETPSLWAHGRDGVHRLERGLQEVAASAANRPITVRSLRRPWLEGSLEEAAGWPAIDGLQTSVLPSSERWPAGLEHWLLSDITAPDISAWQQVAPLTRRVTVDDELRNAGIVSLGARRSIADPTHIDLLVRVAGHEATLTGRRLLVTSGHRRIAEQRVNRSVEQAILLTGLTLHDPDMLVVGLEPHPADSLRTDDQLALDVQPLAPLPVVVHGCGEAETRLIATHPGLTMVDAREGNQAALVVRCGAMDAAPAADAVPTLWLQSPAQADAISRAWVPVLLEEAAALAYRHPSRPVLQLRWPGGAETDDASLLNAALEELVQRRLLDPVPTASRGEADVAWEPRSLASHHAVPAPRRTSAPIAPVLWLVAGVALIAAVGRNPIGRAATIILLVAALGTLLVPSPIGTSEETELAKGMTGELALRNALAARRPGDRDAAAIALPPGALPGLGLDRVLAGAAAERLHLRLAEPAAAPVMGRFVAMDGALGPRLAGVLQVDRPVDVRVSGRDLPPLELDSGRHGLMWREVAGVSNKFEVAVTDPTTGDRLAAFQLAAKGVAGARALVIADDGKAEALAQSLERGGWAVETMSPSRLVDQNLFARRQLIVLDEPDVTSWPATAAVGLADAVQVGGAGLLLLGGPKSLLNRMALAGLEPLSPLQPSDGGAPIDVIVLVDRSGSMGVAGAASFRAGLQAADQLAAVLEADDRLALGLFGTDVRWLTPLARVGPRPAFDADDTFGAAGGTLLRPALAGAINQYTKVADDEPERQRIVLLISDGAFADQDEVLPELARLKGLGARIVLAIPAGVRDAPTDLPVDIQVLVDRDMTVLPRFVPVDQDKQAALRTASPVPPASGPLAGLPPLPELRHLPATTLRADATALMLAEDGRPIVASRGAGAGTVIALPAGLGSWASDWWTSAVLAPWLEALAATALGKAGPWQDLQLVLDADGYGLQSDRAGASAWARPETNLRLDGPTRGSAATASFTLDVAAPGRAGLAIGDLAPGRYVLTSDGGAAGGRSLALVHAPANDLRRHALWKAVALPEDADVSSPSQMPAAIPSALAGLAALLLALGFRPRGAALQRPFGWT